MWRCYRLLVLLLLLALAACSPSAAPPAPDPAATATRDAELAQLTQVAGTMSAVVGTPATPRPQAVTPSRPPASSAARATTPTGAAPSIVTTTTATATATTAARAAGPGLTIFNLVANDLVYDERSKRLYASLPGAAGPQGNSLVSIDPVTGALGTPVPIGSEPNRLALSDDGRYLYVALEGESGIRRYDIGRGVVDAEIALVAGANTGPCFATDLAVVPGQAEMIAVAQGCKSGGAATSSVFAYAGTTPLPAAATTGQASGAIAFCGDSPTLYSYAGTQTMRVEAGGIVTTGPQRFKMTSNGYVHGFRCEGDRLYGSGGEVIDVRTSAPVGQYTGLEGPALVCPDSTVGRVFFLDLGYPQVARLYVYD